ncbi:MAG: hypothetical protein ACE5HY_06010 [Candidatus Hydrothermarchaeales archaeon]
MFRIKVILENLDLPLNQEPRICEYDSETIETGLKIYHILVDLLQGPRIEEIIKQGEKWYRRL